MELARPGCSGEARWIAKHKRWPSSARLSRYACILGVVTHHPCLSVGVAVPPSTGHELGTLHPRAVGWSVAVQGGRSTSVVVVSLDEAVQCSAVLEGL